MEHFHDFQINGQRVFLIEDFAGKFSEITGNPDEFVFLDKIIDVNAEIYINEVELDEFRHLDSKTPVFGFWQLVLQNGLVDFENEISILELSEDAGYYIVTRAGDAGQREILKTGVLKGGMLVGYDLQVDYFSLPRINADFSRLKVPRAVAKTKSEKYSEQKAKVVNEGIAIGLICVAIFVSAFFIGIIFDSKKEQLIIEKARVQAEIEKSKSDLVTLKKRKLVDKKSNMKLVDALAILILLDDGVETIKATSNEKKGSSFTSPTNYFVSSVGHTDNPFIDSALGKSNINIDGRYVIEVSR